ncbi:class I SAM-dependent methyltransferase [Stieleria sp. JC731]|uniref:class I SAM-dependent methyltransferase n=1 Tax=Pirellulaceae TaxID=2691357 RepID=UPI001E5ACF3A|nr:class I SAM-dependent methyltransferase [Stieleria sp. JC731]MCC9603444.1 class I SAM-dependent methyltransferase [Stieleria sp. JC731]
MNYSIVEFLSERLDSQMTLFEYGSGGSTRYFAQRVRQVTSVEYDKSWYDTVAEDLPSNARLIYHPFDNTARYAETIQRQDTRFDVVVVDGQDRVRCVEQSLPCLTEAGIVLLDDSDRECYRPAFKLLSQRGFRALRIAGLKPASCCRHESTVFYRPENCVGL